MSSKKEAKQAGDGLIASDPEDELKVIQDSIHTLLKACQFLKMPEIQQRLKRIKTATALELERAEKVKVLEGALDTISALKDDERKKIEGEKDKVIRKLEKENKKLKDESGSVAKEKEGIAREKTRLQQERQMEVAKNRETEAKREKDMKETLEKEKKRVEEEYLKKAKAAQSNVKATVQSLEKDKVEATKLIKGLNTEVDRLKMCLDTMDTRNEELKAEVHTLQERLRMLNAETAVSRTPSGIYKKDIEHLYQLTGEFATRLSENLPEKAAFVFEPLSTKGKLGQASRIFDYASCSCTPVAASLRRAAVHNFVSRNLISIFQDNLLLSLGTTNNDRHDKEEILNTISTNLEPDDEKVWRGITVKALDKVSKFSGMTQIIEQVTQETVDKLQLLIHDNEQGSSTVRKEVTEIMKAALKIWFLRRNDSCKITFNGAPGPKNDGSWDAWKVEENAQAAFSFPSNGVHAISSGNNGSGTSNGPESPTSSTFQMPTAHKEAQSFVIFPQIIGEFESGDKSHDRGGRNTKSPKYESIVLHRGIAVFSDSSLFDEGLRDIQMLQDDFRGVRHRRQSSLSSSTTMTNKSPANTWLTQPYPQNLSAEPASVNG
ncbi:hypothetical protein AJ78_01909 [Emergomyces pasteurianus Ep9510]|uniref:Uncharacterized protein n=1 Tax=Emergomyces pasteurianus Ep9510 TaxID=1447872 RepID=A0A1J9PNK8_9EURO|nr:hypothetical protein AJ78_01909 [Emergomyces pasteurianus Ep9510]